MGKECDQPVQQCALFLAQQASKWRSLYSTHLHKTFRKWEPWLLLDGFEEGQVGHLINSYYVRAPVKGGTSSPTRTWRSQDWRVSDVKESVTTYGEQWPVTSRVIDSLYCDDCADIRISLHSAWSIGADTRSVKLFSIQSGWRRLERWRYFEETLFAPGMKSTCCR